MKPLFCLLFSVALVFSSLAVFATVSTQSPQNDDQSWMKWTKKDAEKMLSDSPWALNQTETDTSEMFYSPTSPSTRPDNTAERVAIGATNQSVNIKYMIRFFSARPVRRALVRLMELQTNPTPDVVAKLHNFANVKATDSIIVTLIAESPDQRYQRAVAEAINGAVTATLKNDTYLERNGKRLFLEEYVPPGKDGFGARFIFLREMDGKPFISDNTGEVRFHSKFPRGPRVDRRFKVSDMLYNGELEY
ncbi:MAG: hypothetical protein DMF69_09550 [Acidobacteria bacterium]|nr:MAG: hypothetical protein DMF69_09550 [Acidobacteriota bacterium]